MNIPELHLPTENKEFIKNPYATMGEFRESTPVFWDEINDLFFFTRYQDCLLYTSPSPRDLSTSRMPSSA